MIVELGHFSLILALCIAIVQAILPLIGSYKGHAALMQLAVPTAVAQFTFMVLSFGALTWAFVTSDFSLRVVFLNSHTAKPILYKISGVWGNHEGSLLLWLLILAAFGACVAIFDGRLPKRLRARVLSVQAIISVAFYIFILWTSNPFLRLEVPPLNGQDLNPLLQDPGLAFHPPFLYLGYVGLSLTYSFAIAALLEGRIDAAWGRWVRPWTLAAWIFLTIGISLGSWWAYYELGWGGFWFWDPVENASLMPWFISAALLHCAIVVEKRESLKVWTVLLAILAFGFSLLGTFIVRSGVITSVHAFASDPERGIWLLAILAFFLGGGLILYAARASRIQNHGVFAVVSRESALVANNILLSISACIVFIGTIWPLVAEIYFEQRVSVGPPFFNMTVSPFLMGLAVLLPLGPLLTWKRGQVRRFAPRLTVVLLFVVCLTSLLYAVQTTRTSLGPIGVGLGVWVAVGALLDVWERLGKGSFSVKRSRLMRIPKSDFGRAIAHFGFAVTLIGVCGLWAWESEDIRLVQVGETWQYEGYRLTLSQVFDMKGENYFSTVATIYAERHGEIFATLQPEKRFYPVAQMPTTEAGIHNGLWRDLYIVFGEQNEDGAFVVRTYIKPFANWIWSGAFLMSFGGLLSLFDRRMRLGVGTRSSRSKVKAV